MRAGVFSLVEAVFDPNETLQQICDVFSPQATKKAITISWQVSAFLRLPNKYHDHTMPQQALINPRVNESLTQLEM